MQAHCYGRDVRPSHIPVLYQNERLLQRWLVQLLFNKQNSKAYMLLDPETRDDIGVADILR